MSNNSTISELNVDALFRHGIYVVQGVALFICNGLIAVTIGRYEALRDRKEYIIIGTLAVTDAISGISTAAAGLWRIPLYISHKDKVSTTKFNCFLTPHIVIWTFLGPAVYTMLVVSSFDRMLTVAKPMKYLSLSLTYAYRMVIGAYILALAIGLSTFLNAWVDTEPFGAKSICISRMAWGRRGHSMRDRLNAVMIIIAIGLYALIPFWYHKCNMLVHNVSAPDARKLKIQRRLTRTVAMSCFATFVFVALPMIVRAVVNALFESHDMFDLFAPWTLIVKNFNPLLNLFIYVKRQREIKIGLKALFKNKMMPSDLSMWH